jgi:hypothetical protein
MREISAMASITDGSPLLLAFELALEKRGALTEHKGVSFLNIFIEDAFAC